MVTQNNETLEAGTDSLWSHVFSVLFTRCIVPVVGILICWFIVSSNVRGYESLVESERMHTKQMIEERITTLESKIDARDDALSANIKELTNSVSALVRTIESQQSTRNHSQSNGNTVGSVTSQSVSK